MSKIKSYKNVTNIASLFQSGSLTQYWELLTVADNIDEGKVIKRTKCNIPFPKYFLHAHKTMWLDFFDFIEIIEYVLENEVYDC